MANPTTNYGWPMPTATDLVTDLPADFAAFGQPVDTSLKALNPETTLGDIAYRSATANTNTRLPIGTNGQMLTVSGGVPAWATVPGGGKILQVVTATTSTSTSNATNTYADTTLTANITPSSASSRVMVFVMHPYTTIKAAQEVSIDIQLLRDATVIHNPPSGVNSFFLGGAASSAWTNIEHFGILNFSILDSPATTSAITYKTQFKAPNAGTIQVQRNSYTSTIILLEVGP
jgi:hypothetical protein